MVKRLAHKAGLQRASIITPHTLHHTYAAELLADGFTIREVQELLGHKSIETTVRYTHMMIESLKRIYKSHHPRDNDYFEEISSDYLKRLYRFKDQLTKQKTISLKKREIKRRYYLRKKEKMKQLSI